MTLELCDKNDGHDLLIFSLQSLSKKKLYL